MDHHHLLNGDDQPDEFHIENGIDNPQQVQQDELDNEVDPVFFIHVPPVNGVVAGDIHVLDDQQQEANNDVPDVIPPFDLESFHGSGEVSPAGSDDLLLPNANLNWPYVHFTNGYEGQSSNISGTPESFSSFLAHYESEHEERVIPTPQLLFPIEGNDGGQIHQSNERNETVESELSDYTASIEISGEAQRALLCNKDENSDPPPKEPHPALNCCVAENPDNPPPADAPEYACNIQERQHDPVLLPPRGRRDRAKKYFILGIVLSLLLIGSISLIGLSVAKLLPGVMFPISSVLTFVLLGAVLTSYGAVIYYSDKDEEERRAAGRIGRQN